MEYYVAPYSCYSGDYHTHDHYFFYCDCNRPIEVKKEDVKDLYSLPKIDKMHGGGRWVPCEEAKSDATATPVFTRTRSVGALTATKYPAQPRCRDE